MALFRVRLNCVDHYQATPLEFDPRLPPSFRHESYEKWPKVPVIRVFGATETGQKVCAHIHGALPYLYIRYTGPLNTNDVNAHIHQVHLAIDHALAISYRRNMYDSKSYFVALITLVKGVPFYGYHVGYQYFLKIYMLNPIYMTRLADLLRQGAILKRVMQPYESHMQYIAQWMCDYNLFGCAYIDCKEVKFRAPVPSHMQLADPGGRWHDQSIAEDWVSDGSKIARQSHCSIEIDVCVHHIQNRDSIKPRLIHHDFVERDTRIAPDQKLVHSMAGLWRDETRRRKARLGMTDSDSSSPFPPEVLLSVSANPRDTQPGGWIHETEFREKMDLITEKERLSSDGHEIRFDNFIDKGVYEDYVKTSLESVEDLYPETLANLRASQHAYQEASQNFVKETKPVVDESRLLYMNDDDIQFESDNESIQGLDFPWKREGDVVDEPTTENAITALKMSDYQSIARAVQSEKEQISPDEFGIPGGEPIQGPTSSTEFEKLGIRDVGDLSKIKEDAFNLSRDCTSDLDTNRADLSSAEESTPSKRQKVLSHVHSKLKNVSHGDQYISESINNQYIHHGGNQGTTLPEAETLRSRESKEIPAVNEDPFGEPNETSSSASRESGHFARNAKLPFTVVKDPQDPHTILKLSQRSTSPSRVSKNPKLDAISYTNSSGANPKVSSCNGSSALTTAENPQRPSMKIGQPLSRLRTAFDMSNKCQLMFVAQAPPSRVDMQTQMDKDGIPSVVYQDAFYSDDADVPERSREYAGKEYKFESGTVPFLPKFAPTAIAQSSVGAKAHGVIDRVSQDNLYTRRRRNCTSRTWEVDAVPPTRPEVQKWVHDEIDRCATLQLNGAELQTSRENVSQVEQATQLNRHGFKYSQKKNSTSVRHETQYMSIMSLEIHINTRANLVPNPEQDEVCCVFWCVQSEDEDLEVNGLNEGSHVGILALSADGTMALRISQQVDVEVEQESSELDLINRFVDIVRGYDPDILTGYEVHGSSWGYLIERARCKYDYDLCDELSRTISDSHGRFGKEDDRWGFNHTSTIRVTGRHMINIWRAMRGELNLLQYTIENVVFQLCHRRIPHYNFHDLTCWYLSGKPQDLAKVVNYYLSRVQLDIEILEENELVPRTSEQARLLGVDFFSVFSRGSQFKVESLMFRIAKPENLLLPSPSRKQVGQQNALECLPLVMEPQSAFYNNPVLVLDFQSLYPSVMIAYNYCYSTYLGRVVDWRGQNKMGFTDYQRKPRLLELLGDQINIAPNGIMYAKPGVRKSLLAKMLGEILETRVMVKSGMKVDKEDRTLQRLLNNRQLALKLIANVTYGYTSASFSGRMPCSEIADSIVQTGRETLEKAIALIHSVERWGAEVVYGDTDSLFVHLKGRTKDEAFDIGEEIAKTITDINPRPIKLKFEKVYLPSILLAKKRYVGFKYENKRQRVPDFDAKGIETIRRDGTPAEQKVEEAAIKILFRTADLTQVKSFVQRQFSKIMRGKVSIQDFCFAKEVKLGTYSDKGIPPPGALISTKKMLKDPRAEPQYGERVSYVVITGAPGARLVDRCVAPGVLLHDDNHELDAEYYISKNLIPPLERIFNLVGANIRQWYDEMPKYQRIRRVDANLTSGSRDRTNMRKTLESYLKSTACLVCNEKLEEDLAICNGCLEDPDTSTFNLLSRLSKAEQRAMSLVKVCKSCSGLGRGEKVVCDSQDCPVFYTRTRHMSRLKTLHLESQPVLDLLKEVETIDMDW